MTDTDHKRMLEMAAKAAGIRVCWHGSESCARNMDLTDPPRIYWNPLTDDGDALRLAVKTGEPFVVRSRCVTTMGGLVEDFDPAVSGDDLRATRRAIVRAAAAIGEKMP